MAFRERAAERDGDRASQKSRHGCFRSSTDVLLSSAGTGERPREMAEGSHKRCQGGSGIMAADKWENSMLLAGRNF